MTCLSFLTWTVFGSDSSFFILNFSFSVCLLLVLFTISIWLLLAMVSVNFFPGFVSNPELSDVSPSVWSRDKDCWSEVASVASSRSGFCPGRRFITSLALCFMIWIFFEQNLKSRLAKLKIFLLVL